MGCGKISSHLALSGVNLQEVRMHRSDLPWSQLTEKPGAANTSGQLVVSCLDGSVNPEKSISGTCAAESATRNREKCMRSTHVYLLSSQMSCRNHVTRRTPHACALGSYLLLCGGAPPARGRRGTSPRAPRSYPPSSRPRPH